MKLSLALILVMSGCAAPKKRLVVPPGCIKRIEPIKACEPEKDGTHAVCLFRITYDCVEYR
jgi:hypothetical protein